MSLQDTAGGADGENLERPVWPEGQKIERVGRLIALTHFTDMADLLAGLGDYLIALEREKRARAAKGTAGFGGTKLYHVDSWPVPGARLLDRRAQMLYREVVGHATSAVDLSWANVYRAGDYILPHGHRRATGSVLFMLSAGERDEEDSLSGRFAIADPRLPLCCREDPSCMSTPYFPDLEPGSMIVFPSHAVHLATPYRGRAAPRITLSWNLNEAPLPDGPEGGWREIPPHPDKD